VKRRLGFLAFAASVAIACVCAALIGWRLTTRRAASPPAASIEMKREAPAAPKASPAVKISAIIDLPGDPVLVRRGPVAAPKDLLIAVPAKLTPEGIRPGSPGYAVKQAYFVNSTLASTDGGNMSRFSEAGQEADALVAQVVMNSEQGQTQAQMDAGSDDDGGADTPWDAQAQVVTSDNSNRLEINSDKAQGKAQILDVVLKPIVAEKIADLLIANGFAEESARALESAAAAQLHVQTLPPGSVVVAVGALDASADYRAVQITVFEGGEYIGTVALGEGGEFGEGAEPVIPSGLMDDTARQGEVAVRYSVADGVYSAGLRNGVPEAIIREAIQLVAGLADLKAPLQSDQTVRLLFMRDFRDKAKSTGRVLYIGLHGGGLAVDCYAFEESDGRFRCFNPKAESETPTPEARPRAGESLGSSGATAVGGILAPIKGAPVTSLFGMRFHPILHILRLHAGIDFGAPVGSPVRASADGKIEIAGPVSGFGNHIRIQHTGFETSYSHLSEIPDTIKPGVDIKQGDIIALSGNTGLSTGPHLHFEFYLNREAVDPLPHMGTDVQSSAPTPGSSPSPVLSVAVGGASSGATAVEIAAFPAIKSYIDSRVAELIK
jgi:murein DD-endopeptidase MepM/ murein hydrolase activator NlpD